MKTLITGGAGYTGSLLAQALQEAGHEVTVLDNFMFGYDSILPLISHPKFHIIKRDIRHEDMSYVEGMDVVFHLAAISGYPACDANPHSAQMINITATQRLAEALTKDQVLVFASTTSFYGSTGEHGDEETEISAHNLYSMTKLEGERIVMERENSISLRWATVFGISNRMREGLLVNDFVERAISENAIVLYDAGSRRSFIHVRDLIRGYVFTLDNLEAMRGEIFNMGSNNLNYTKREIAEKIMQVTGCEIMESSVGDKDVRNFFVNYDKIGKLGFDTEISLEDGIEELVKLFLFYTPNSFIKPI
jgi:nucleoside-diphosphate-sugar epimerase